MMEKTYSQNIARGFEIAGYVLLVPALLSLIYPFFFLIGGLFSLNGAFLMIGLLPFLVVAVGFALLVGYYKHSRGLISEYHVSTLWLTTAVYNFLLLLPFLYGAAAMYQDFSLDKIASESFVYFLGMLIIILMYVTAIVCALKAYAFDKRFF